jgi:serine phosphatase RsbU (regulator of sigma subunit)/anti-sigma regulatory factor (Ser/Thr protein kinase)
MIGGHDTSTDTEAVRRYRTWAVDVARDLGRRDLVHDVGAVVSELATNAMLHGGGIVGVNVVRTGTGVRIEVRDRSRVPPVVARPTEDALTGRGLRLVMSMAERWGAATVEGGKIVWAEVCGDGRPADVELEQDLAAVWDDWDMGDAGQRVRVELGDVPTELLLAAKSHVDNIIRESTLAGAGAATGMSSEIPPRLSALLTAVVNRFSEARVSIKHQALDAARRGAATTHLVLDVPTDAADAALEYIAALDELDAYSRASRLLTVETPPQHRVFRHWYVGELVAQLRAVAQGHPAPPAQPFGQRLLDELDRVAAAQRVADRAARLYSVAAALATADTPEAVGDVVLREGVAALGATAGGILLATDSALLAVPAVVGYDDAVVAQLRDERRDAELPAATALRTGEPVWLESRADRDRRFPQLAGMEAGTAALCAVPLDVDGRTLGAIRFSFGDQRLFDDDERRFVLALAAQTAQALDRAQLQHARVDVSRRLQRSLLPPTLPAIADVDVAAMYHPFGAGIDVGGDFYDVWPLDRERWAFAIGDATGTGPEAAALTALVRHTLRAVTMYEARPAEVISSLNTALLAAASEGNERFCTAIFGVLSRHSGRVRLDIASGGHPGPFLVRDDGSVEQVALDGTLLGVFDRAEVSTAAVALDAGDGIVFLTDGVLEARHDGEMFDVARVEAVVGASRGSASAIVAGIDAAVIAHTGGALLDDMAALAFVVSTVRGPVQPR